MDSTKKPLSDAALRSFAKAHFDAWNAHDVEACIALMTDDVVYEDPGFESAAHGKAEVAARIRAIFTAFPDIHFPEEMAHVHTNVDDAECVLTWTFYATMTGDLVAPEGKMPATGKKIQVSGASFNRFRGDLLSHFTMYYDSLDMMVQLGFLPKTNGLGFKAVVLADLLAGKAKKVLHMA
ncbi:nuclear transport factor 2 family protein [Intrasporangium sp. DVR]|uniref:ester cyclase n=1 Tax=Intrasporangium sp. DVR TaxID=3127867 RepID=UPI00313A4DA8